MFHPFKKTVLVALLWTVVLVFGQASVLRAQQRAVGPEVAALLRQGAVVHRRITMLARRVQVDLRDSRRFGVVQRAACLSDVLSDLHSTQRALDAWTVEIGALEHPSDRLRGMLVVLRGHLKDLRSEARGCFGGGDLVYGVVKVEVKIEGPQPDDDPHHVPQPVIDDVPWVVPQP